MRGKLCIDVMIHLLAINSFYQICSSMDDLNISSSLRYEVRMQTMITDKWKYSNSEQNNAIQHNE